jgi:hypothetical protein
MEMLQQPVKGPSLWTRSTMEGQDWLWRLSEAELADLHQALQSVEAKGLGCGDFDASDFRLAVMADRLKAIKQEIMDGRGFAVMRGLPVEHYSIPQLEAIYWGIGCYLGRAITQNDEGDLLTHVTMHGLDGSKQLVRGYQDRRYQEPHNDRADLVGLLCVRTARSGGLSSIVNSAALYNELLREHPEYLPIMYRGFRIHRGAGIVTDEPVKAFNYFRGRLFIWFQMRNIERAVQKLGPLPELERKALDYFTELASRSEFRLDMSLEPGDMQFVNNYTVLHSRTAYEDYEEPSRWRVLLRLWLNLEEQELDPDFAKYTRRTVYPPAPTGQRVPA